MTGEPLDGHGGEAQAIRTRILTGTIWDPSTQATRSAIAASGYRPAIKALQQALRTSVRRLIDPLTSQCTLPNEVWSHKTCRTALTGDQPAPTHRPDDRNLVDTLPRRALQRKYHPENIFKEKSNKCPLKPKGHFARCSDTEDRDENSR